MWEVQLEFAFPSVLDAAMVAESLPVSALVMLTLNVAQMLLATLLKVVELASKPELAVELTFPDIALVLPMSSAAWVAAEDALWVAWCLPLATLPEPLLA